MDFPVASSFADNLSNVTTSYTVTSGFMWSFPGPIV